MNNHGIGAKRVQGSALTVAILLLLLLTIAAFVAVPTMLGEQRVSGNDVRAKVAHHVAEAGLNHGREFLRINSGTLVPIAGEALGSEWTVCGSDEREFPCGAVESDLISSSRRATHYKYTAGANNRSVTFPSGRMYDGVDNDAGSFNASYDVGILLCRMSTASACTLNSGTTVGTSLFTLVSRGAVDAEHTTATVTETIGTYRIVNLPPNIPPMMAAGTIQGVGNSTLVGNPNAGGFGVPLTVWARNDFASSTGSWQTCQMDEYIRSNLGAVQMRGTNKDIPICTDCSCPAGKQLSNKDSEGVDILDSNDGDGGKVKATTNYYFPCDLFEYVFGISARTDGNNDGYCETLKTDAGVAGVADVVEWLTANADPKTCGDLNPSSEGLIWIQSACSGGNQLSGKIGSPEKPVLLVIDGAMKLNTNAEIYGIVFLRYPGANSTPCILGGNGTGCPEIEAGGGGAKVFGSIIVEGDGKLNGTIDLVYVPQLIVNFNKSPNNNRFAGLPGSWSDRVSY